MGFQDTIDKLDYRLQVLEERFSGLGFDMKSIVTSEMNDRWKIAPEANTRYGMVSALCVSTIDPWKQGRVQFFTPNDTDPDVTVDSLGWAWPISSMGGFDDCGLNWVPPAGSMLCLIFEQGNTGSPFYMGTTWSRNRGPEGQHNWGFPMPEFDRVSSGHRKGYILPPNDESQVLPPWNTESYNGNDIDNIGQFENDPTAQKKITTPNIYGFKTPEKHMVKLVDGDPQCDRRWKRIEIQSGGKGGWIMIKDDQIRPSGQWAHPDCSCGGGDLSDCTTNPDQDCDKPATKPKCANPYYKNQNECWPYQGPGTPQNNKASLDQTGIQFLSGSGHSEVFDDSVEEPRGKPTWERSLESFDFGCTNLFKGKMEKVTATGHRWGGYDDESDTNVRSDMNGIKFLTASGNLLFGNDHTVAGNLAGQQRGWTMESTSKHILQLCDWNNNQASPPRTEGGMPTNEATKAYILVRTGYGLQIMMADRASQQETQTQYIEVLCPMIDNQERGPHILLMQEAASGPGIIFLRAGGNYVIDTYDEMLTVVGDPDKNPSDKITIVTKQYIINTTDIHFHYTGKQHIFFAEDKIFLLAGRDCPSMDADGNTVPMSAPCVYNVVINRNVCPCPLITWMLHFTPGNSTSERVFASGYSPDEAPSGCPGGSSGSSASPSSPDQDGSGPAAAASAAAAGAGTPVTVVT